MSPGPSSPELSADSFRDPSPPMAWQMTSSRTSCATLVASETSGAYMVVLVNPVVEVIIVGECFPPKRKDALVVVVFYWIGDSPVWDCENGAAQATFWGS